MDINLENAETLVLGGGLLGAGGGGDWQEGLELLHTALRIGRPKLLAIEEVDANGMLATVSGVGAPAAKEQDVVIADHLMSVELFVKNVGTSLVGLISSENGGFSSANGFVQSALSGLPVIDAPGNGRAHPTGVMGSMGLHKDPSYRSKQAAVGGTPGKRDVHLYIEGALGAVDHIVRQAAVGSGGLVAVTRNPVSAGYVKQHGAPGALQLAINLGEIILAKKGDGGKAVAEAVLEYFGNGVVIGCGEVGDYHLRTEGGYDVGQLMLGTATVTFWNEFMTVDQGGARLATFPDLIFALNARTGLPTTTATIGNGSDIVLATVPKDYIPLGAGVKDPQILNQVEAVLGVSMAV